MRVLVYFEGCGTAELEVGRELVSAAKILAGTPADISAVVRGAISDDRTAMFGDVANLYVLEDDGFYLPDREYALVDAALDAAQADVLLVPYSAKGIDVGPAIAGMRDWSLAAYCKSLSVGADGSLDCVATAYGGKLDARMEVSFPAVIEVVPGAFEADETTGAGPTVTRLDVSASSAFNVDEVLVAETDGVDISASGFLVSIGRGIGGEEDVENACDFAKTLGADLSASRPIIDAGWMPKSRQVGKSGTKVQAKVYLAMGISGAPEHLEGIGDVDTVIAVNKDKDAPIFEAAQYGVVCDLNDFMDALKTRAAS